jgi:hypothetical protein
MSPKLMGRPDAHDTAAANATRFSLKAEATPHVMHLTYFCKIALWQPALFLPARANR